MKKPVKEQGIRNWTLYVIKFTDGTYYVGITAFKDFMRRIRQHGSARGAHWAKGKVFEMVVETRDLGRIPRIKAENIENEVTLHYKKKYGRKVRGGYNAFVRPSIIPNYTPGSTQSLFLILMSLLLALVVLAIITNQFD